MLVPRYQPKLPSTKCAADVPVHDAVHGIGITVVVSAELNVWWPPSNGSRRKSVHIFRCESEMYFPLPNELSNFV